MPDLTAAIAPSAVIGQIQADVLGRSLLIAAVVVSPYAFYKWRQVARTRAETAELIRAASAPEELDTRPKLEDVIAAIGRHDGDGTVHVPRGLTVDGQAAPPAVVDALVRDALRRSGLVATAEVETHDGRVLEVVRRATGADGPDAAR